MTDDPPVKVAYDVTLRARWGTTGKPEVGITRVTAGWLRALASRSDISLSVTTRLAVEPVLEMERIRVLGTCAGYTLDPTYRSRLGVASVYRRLAMQRHVGTPSRVLRRALLSIDAKRTPTSADVVHSLSEVFPEPARSGARHMLTIYDLIPITHGATCSEHERERADALVRSAATVDSIVTISEWSKEQIVAVCAVEPSRVTVIPLGTPDVFQTLPGPEARASVRRASGVLGEYILAIASSDRRKNVEGVVAAYHAASRGDRKFPQLVLVNALGVGVEALVASAGIPTERIVLLPGVSDSDLASWMADACAFLFLSRAEGFGLPVLEAMTAGAPVIAASATCLPEIVGDAGILVGANDANACAAAMRHLWTSPGDRAALVARGSVRSRAFGWASGAAALAETYRGLAG